MFPSLHSALTVTLGRDAVRVEQRGREIALLKPAQNGVNTLHEALSLLEQAKDLPRGRLVDFRLNDAWVRFLTVEWPEDAGGHRERDQLAQAWLARVFGADNHWHVGRDAWRVRGSELFAAISATSLQALQTSAQTMGWRIRSITPCFASRFNAITEIAAENAGVLVALDGTRASVGIWERGHWRAFRNLAVASFEGLAEQLAQMRASLTLGAGPELPVFVSGKPGAIEGAMPAEWKALQLASIGMRRPWQRAAAPGVLTLDMARRAAPSRTIAWGAIVAGLAFAAVAATSQLQRLEKNEYAQNEVVRLKTLEQRVRAGSSKPVAAADEKEIKRGLAMVRGLSAPWPNLLVELESFASPDIALLSVDSDARKGSVRLTGQARNMNSLFAYVRTLEKSSVLNAPRLSSYATKTEGTVQSVAFDLVAAWGAP